MIDIGIFACRATISIARGKARSAATPGRECAGANPRGKQETAPPPSEGAGGRPERTGFRAERRTESSSRQFLFKDLTIQRFKNPPTILILSPQRAKHIFSPLDLI